MTDEKPPQSLGALIAQTRTDVAEQLEQEAASIPAMRRWRVPAWAAAVLAATAAAAVYWASTRPPLPVDEVRAAEEATFAMLRAAVEAYRDSTGLAPSSLEVIGYGGIPAAYVRSDSSFSLALPRIDADSLRAQGPARRILP